mmetsp:Transcript_15734/g.42979  ORF Transcript_15734/g.42979 Transcript_15734/m.42979 type:complete len:223 (-) Transcript_15734:638-1306(-)
MASVVEVSWHSPTWRSGQSRKICSFAPTSSRPTRGRTLSPSCTSPKTRWRWCAQLAGHQPTACLTCAAAAASKESSHSGITPGARPSWISTQGPCASRDLTLRSMAWQVGRTACTMAACTRRYLRARALSTLLSRIRPSFQTRMASLRGLERCSAMGATQASECWRPLCRERQGWWCLAAVCPLCPWRRTSKAYPRGWRDGTLLAWPQCQAVRTRTLLAARR